ncbi:MAG: carboxypeptidase-like regulatory domain-containing protein, partial [Acidobacteria bacterium]|nr:carboxypeptidase-like regulatory domain-containing protein [Acidobacteriota bacterium]
MSAVRFLLKAVLAIALVLATSLPLFAQVDRGIIEVVVLDESGATLPGVTVTARRPETGQQLVEVTGTNGLARFPSLPPGTWEIRSELPGFAGAGVDGIALRVGQTSRVNFTLRPSASETITVQAASEVVDVYKTDASTNILPEQIEMLPVAD